ncbi:hypothetical protein [Noviherbaspirillum sedimenti]|uniref:Uncharacterized protein n=1 Tax=Noviherbaspirillum sedimenti TaxID=2320865 RepID=A0A3A3GHL2_9BURK|nr:hypothetical protein [Noviherbaspirillum sedimenti]RJG00390.1 hypothetical protein D3878_01355 [Noviherbaspirillum sedimenti]
MIPGSIEYAQVRIQSRYAARANAAAWREMEHARELSALLEIARAAGFDRVVAQLPMPPGLHELDCATRNHWRERVDEVAGWMPVDWQAALRWCALIVDLPFIQYLANGGMPYRWMQCDMAFANPGASPGKRLPAMKEMAGLFAGLHEPWVDPDAVASGWCREWRSRMPRLSEEEAAHFMVLVRAIESHLAAFAKAAGDEGWRHRHLLEEKLAALFRRFTLEPPAAFAFLALQWLDLERLRGEIATRIAFPSRSLAP